MKQLDLGSGSTIRQHPDHEAWGVDIVDVGNPKVKVADLTFKPIPFEDNSFDLVTAYDFIEHIPMVVYQQGKSMVKHNTMIGLFNEIYRVLKPNGIFYSQTPCYPHLAIFQDPTHVSVWTTESFHYFSGDYYGFHDHYGHTSRFQKMSQVYSPDNSHLHVELKAIKHLGPQEPYLLSY